MSRTTMMGLFGGVLIALSVFISDSGISFDQADISASAAIVTLISGIAIIVCLLVKQFAWALYFTIAATTVAVIALIDLFREGGTEISIGVVVLFAGVVLAIISTERPSRKAGL